MEYETKTFKCDLAQLKYIGYVQYNHCDLLSIEIFVLELIGIKIKMECIRKIIFTIIDYVCSGPAFYLWLSTTWTNDWTRYIWQIFSKGLTS